MSTEPTESNENASPEEEVTQGDWNISKVELKRIDVMTGEEEEEILWKQRAKLYRWSASKTEGEPGEWKERGIGDAKLLKHKESGKIRFLLRQEKTLKIVANHYVLGRDNFCILTPNAGSDKIWVWTTPNTSDDQTQIEQLALKFGQISQAEEFKKEFENALKINKEIFAKDPPEENDGKDSSKAKDDKDKESK
ncbi:small monomeric GTPase [Babesia microti strain RI]|uniref:Small monomeric GTPase n=1 Tax=Babesia microti (strain RI) TaxID=1133968 RepID=I7IQ87_BABMR|nr:small monomeric GTPase [Babesia microti strain RI]CCF73585.1 small monomeric GTPase [Babesia microti strain RI]|eukprot:XP_012648194.1 small monomeric GTPase [Babesia microti strain RI]